MWRFLAARGGRAEGRPRLPQDQCRARCRRSCTSTPTSRSIPDTTGKLDHRGDVGHLLQARFRLQRRAGRRHALQDRTSRWTEVRARSLRPELDGIRRLERVQGHVDLGPGLLPQAASRARPGSITRRILAVWAASRRDSFPIFDVFRENCYVIADSNHGYKMIGVGELVAEEILGSTSTLLAPFPSRALRAGRAPSGLEEPVPLELTRGEENPVERSGRTSSSRSSCSCWCRGTP